GGGGVGAAVVGALAEGGGGGGWVKGFRPAGNDDLGIAIEDRLVAEGDGAQSGAAQLVDAPGRDLDREPRRNRGLACRVLALSGREDLAQDNLGYALGLHPGTLQRRRDRNLSEPVG